MISDFVDLLFEEIFRFTIFFDISSFSVVCSMPENQSLSYYILLLSSFSLLFLFSRFSIARIPSICVFFIACISILRS